MASSDQVTQVCIVGGGNAAQVMIALFGNARDSGKRIRVHCLAPMNNEAEKLKGPIALENPDGSETVGAADAVSKEAVDVVPGSKVIFLPLPTFAMPAMLQMIKPHLDPGVMIGALPGQGGFQWMAVNILEMNKPGAKAITIFGFNKLPYNCRTVEYGKKVHVFGYKTHLSVGIEPPTNATQHAKFLENLIPKMVSLEPLQNFLVVTLAPANQCIHPARMYGLFHKQTHYDTVPHFYDDMDQESADVMQCVSDEILAIARGLENQAKKNGIDLDLSECMGVGDALRDAYEVEDPSSLLTTLRTTNGLHKILTPMIKNPNGGYDADFTCRYFTEDIPALLVLYGLGCLAGVDTPTMKTLILWAQNKLPDAHPFIHPDGSLNNDKKHELFTAQYWGITSISELLRISHSSGTKSNSVASETNDEAHTSRSCCGSWM